MNTHKVQIAIQQTGPTGLFLSMPPTIRYSLLFKIIAIFFIFTAPAFAANNLAVRFPSGSPIPVAPLSGSTTNGHCAEFDANGNIIDSGSACPSTGISITSFTNNKNNLEKGISVSSTVLNWTTNHSPTTLSLNQGIGSISAALTTYTDTATYTTTRTYTLTAGDGVSTDTANTSVTFLDSNYYGVNSSATLNDSDINALTSALSTTRVQTRNGLSPSGQYIYICYPASYGTATFTVNGFFDNSWVLSVQSHTNASGSTSSYNVYHSANLLTGTYNVVVN